jgi:transposase
MRPKGSAEVLSRRRRRALALLDEGYSLNEVARRMDCQASSVMRWRDARDRLGEKAFDVGVSPGRPAKLTAAQKRKLVRLLLKGPIAHGFATDLWTCERIARVIRREFRVRYHRDHIGRMMRELGWSHQKPERRALERDDEAIERWKRKDWPRVKKTLRGWVPTSSSSTNRASS